MKIRGVRLVARRVEAVAGLRRRLLLSSFSFLSSLKLRDTKVYELQIPANLGTADHFCGLFLN